MNKLEKIITIGGFVIGVPLLSLGLYMDKFPERDNYLLKCLGLIFCSAGAGMILHEIVEEKRYYGSKKE